MITKTLTLNPEGSKAQSKLDYSDFPLVEKTADEVLKKDPEDPFASRTKAAVLLEKGQPALASEVGLHNYRFWEDW